MSKWIDEIVKDIRENPKSWKRYDGTGLQKEDVVITKCGNGSKWLWGWCTSIVDIKVNDKDTYFFNNQIDRYKIEEAVLWWMKNATLEMIKS